jgi:hypothetical protein
MDSAPACAVCNGPFVRTDEVIYLGAEKALMHRSCCHRHPSGARVAAVPSRHSASREAERQDAGAA